MRILALDHGAARTGVAVCDETATIVRPLGVVEHVDTVAGFADLIGLLTREQPGRIVVGLPVSLDGREHAQARRARAFATRLSQAVEVPVELYDERFTSKLADQRGGKAARDARAAATLLEDYLRYRGEQQIP
jgi:putative Holliday junction resolvase